MENLLRTLYWNLYIPYENQETKQELDNCHKQRVRFQPHSTDRNRDEPNRRKGSYQLGELAWALSDDDRSKLRYPRCRSHHRQWQSVLLHDGWQPQLL